MNTHREISFILDKYRPRLEYERIFIAPDIPQIQLRHALRFAYAYNSKGEEVFGLIDLSVSGNGAEGILLTNKKLYVYAIGSKPVNFGLNSLHSLHLQEELTSWLYVNNQKILPIPGDIKDYIKPFIEMVGEIVAQISYKRETEIPEKEADIQQKEQNEQKKKEQMLQRFRNIPALEEEITELELYLVGGIILSLLCSFINALQQYIALDFLTVFFSGVLACLISLIFLLIIRALWRTSFMLGLGFIIGLFLAVIGNLRSTGFTRFFAILLLISFFVLPWLIPPIGKAVYSIRSFILKLFHITQFSGDRKLLMPLFIGIIIVGVTYSGILWHKKRTLLKQEAVMRLKTEYYQKAIEYDEAGDKKNAIKLYTKVIELDPKHADAYFKRGLLYGQRENYNLAISDLYKVTELKPYSGNVHGTLGWYLILQGKFDEAKTPCREACKLEPKSLSNIFNLGHAYLLSSNVTTARMHYQKALSLVESKEELNEAIGIFDIFIKKGWQVGICRQEMKWIKQEFKKVVTNQLQQIERLYQQAVKIDKAENFAILYQRTVKNNILKLEDIEKAAEYHTKILELYVTHDHGYWFNADSELALITTDKIADSYFRLGWYLILQGKFKKAEELFDENYKFSYIKALPHKFFTTLLYGHTLLLVESPNARGRYSTAFTNYLEKEYEFNAAVAGLELFVKNGWQVEACNQMLLWMKQEFETGYRFHLAANKYRASAEKLAGQGQYLEAAQLFAKSAEAEKRNPSPRATVLETLRYAGYYYEQIGEYDKARVYYEQALELAQGHLLGVSSTDFRASFLSNIGDIYYAWGKYDKAIEYYTQLLEVAHKSYSGPQGRLSALALNKIGEIYYKWEQNNLAIEYNEQALEIGRRLKNSDLISQALDNIGRIYLAWGMYNKALAYYEQTLELYRKLRYRDAFSEALNNIGGVYEAWKQYDKALTYYEESLDIDHGLDRKPGMATDHDKIGHVYYTLEHFPEAIIHFRESLTFKEQLRKTAVGELRRDYLASQIHTYQYLTSCYVQTGELSHAFQTIELSRAKLLSEQLAGSEEVDIPSLKRIQRELPEEVAVILYANANWPQILQVVITKNEIISSERSIDPLIQDINKYSLTDRAKSDNGDLRKFTIVQDGQEEVPVTIDTQKRSKFGTLNDIIEYYRILLQNPAESGKSEVIGSLLYEFLLEDIQEQFREKTRLLIVPDGVLNFLPFETLVDTQGKYLVENYHISYAQSLTVLELIHQRQYILDRKPLLAFGGAIYDASTYEVQMIENEAQLAYLQKQVDTALSQGSSVGKLYAQLNRAGWKNLPGTLTEVKAIQDVVEGAEIVIGQDVNESKVKELSERGEFAKYKVLHFATHGDADPRIPELSALVLSLSQVSGDNNNNDGYLRAGEIYNLKLNADFVNLSACETGLGKLYSGEGMVGLTQAFLLAGANGLSVSLWQVSDKSTAQFMVALYKLVEEQGLNYIEAITKVKCRFIAGDFGEKWKAPYYWAPFVYYGKS